MRLRCRGAIQVVLTVPYYLYVFDVKRYFLWIHVTNATNLFIIM
jgi:hypothetical protein